MRALQHGLQDRDRSIKATLHVGQHATEQGEIRGKRWPR